MERTGYVQILVTQTSWPSFAHIGRLRNLLRTHRLVLLMGDKVAWRQGPLRDKVLWETSYLGRQTPLGDKIAWETSSHRHSACQYVHSKIGILSRRYNWHSKYCFSLSHSGPAL